MGMIKNIILDVNQHRRRSERMDLANGVVTN
jgi:hypothetical protein